MKKLNNQAKDILLLVVYAILFLLPVTLNHYILDYTFNFALAQLTLSMFLLMYDFDTFAYQIYLLKTTLQKQFILFLVCTAVFASLYVLHFTGIMLFSTLFANTTHVGLLLMLMEGFSIYFCLHLNEAYLFEKIRMMLPSWDRLPSVVVTALLFVVFHLALVHPSELARISAHIVYYVAIGSALIILSYFNSSFLIYVVSGFLLTMILVLL